MKAVILGTTYGKDGETVTKTAQTVGGDTVSYTVPSKISRMYTATETYADKVEVLAVADSVGKADASALYREVL